MMMKSSRHMMTAGDRFSIASWNVWFDPLGQQQRYSAILSACRMLSPDVICFQEVTPPFVSMLDASDIRDDYCLSDHELDRYPYGNMILAKKCIDVSFQFISLPSQMGRKMLLAEATWTDGTRIGVGNVHLESLSSRPVREQQLQVCEQVLRDYDLSILCGDFNFCSYRNYNCIEADDYNEGLENDVLGRIMPDYNDMWPQVHPTEQGYTFDTVENGMLRLHRHERMRYDRICYRVAEGDQSMKLTWAAHSIDLLGTSPVSSDASAVAPQLPTATATATAAPSDFNTPPKVSRSVLVQPADAREPVRLFPSDHFGLFGVFTS